MRPATPDESKRRETLFALIAKAVDACNFSNEKEVCDHLLNIAIHTCKLNGIPMEMVVAAVGYHYAAPTLSRRGLAWRWQHRERAVLTCLIILGTVIGMVVGLYFFLHWLGDVLGKLG